ncbi:MAG: single-stranded-DNA-specific exonuclease RecJ [Anaerolineales bacterium]
MHRVWRFPDPIPESELRMLGAFPPLHAQLLHRRGLRSPRETARFLDARTPDDTQGQSLVGIGAAVTRLLRAREQGQRIVVFGDYDADGVTATAVLEESLRGWGWIVGHYIPNRFDEGYGLNLPAMKELADSGVAVVISVDCGIRSLEEVAWAQDHGVDVIVTDHHEPGPELPRAKAVVNPRQPGETYPFVDFAGAGVAYKLVQAIAAAVDAPEPEAALDLVALGTIADLASLTGENRSLVARGLDRMNRTPRPGVAALVAATGAKAGALTAASVGYVLGPRLNAAGRLESAELSLHLLLESDPKQAEGQARKLDDLNRERQRLTRETTERAREILLAEPELLPILIAAAPEFPEGVVGLAASRLVEEFHRPAIVATLAEGIVRGSARSIAEFPITAALDSCRKYLLRYGGHTVAAGFSLSQDQWPAFCDAMLGLARAAFAGGMPSAEMSIDAVADPNELRDDLLQFLDRLEPCGRGNPRPLLALRGAEVLRVRRVGSDQRHLKLTLRGGKRIWDAIAFRQPAEVGEGMRLDVAFYLERNEYLGVSTLQLNVQDLREAPSVAT